MAPRGWFCFFSCTSSEINWAVYIGVLLQKWRSASFVASRDLSFCCPATVPLVNGYDSVPVQSYRSEGSWALCLVIPWERLNCPALWEPKHWFYRQNYKRERKKNRWWITFFPILGRLTAVIELQEKDKSRFKAQREKLANKYSKIE